jgi:hypothetical protein
MSFSPFLKSVLRFGIAVSGLFDSLRGGSSQSLRITSWTVPEPPPSGSLEPYDNMIVSSTLPGCPTDGVLPVSYLQGCSPPVLLPFFVL